MSHLRQLLSILTNAIDTIEQEASKSSVAYPTVDDVFDPNSPSEQFATKPKVLEASSLGASAASQIFATLCGPGPNILSLFSAFHISSALRVATEAGVVELLRENPSGLSIQEIGKRTGTDPSLMGRIMRLLATHYVFREVEPNVFSNNRLSSIIDTGKSSELISQLNKIHYSEPSDHTPFFMDIQAEKYHGTSGIGAALEHFTDEAFKSSAFLTEYVFSSDRASLPFNRAFSTPAPWWDYVELPENKGRLARSQSAFEGGTKLEPITSILQGFKWEALPEATLIADVGGGNGSLSFYIADANPHLHFTLVDRPAVLKDVAIPLWNSDSAKKKILDSGRMSFLGHSFFEPFPASISGKVDVFLLRYITHDWADDACLKILHHLHTAAKPNGRLILVDHVVPYACAAPNIGKEIPGGVPPLPPSPLLANMGPVNSRIYFLDFHVMIMLGAQERTLGEFTELLLKAGWKIAQVYNPPGSTLQQVECVKC